jgi:hypothetical protein
MNASLKNWGILPPNDYFGLSMNGTAWFCSVVWFQYLIFPFILPWLLHHHQDTFAWSENGASCSTFANALAPRECFSESVPMNLFFPGMCMLLARGLLGL